MFIKSVFALPDVKLLDLLVDIRGDPLFEKRGSRFPYMTNAIVIVGLG